MVPRVVEFKVPGGTLESCLDCPPVGIVENHVRVVLLRLEVLAIDIQAWLVAVRSPRRRAERCAVAALITEIGENGDLYLAVPFLASVGPISGAFFGY